MKNVSRREFLKGAAVSALGVAALGVVPMNAVAEEKWDVETDVLVVGAGGTAVVGTVHWGRKAGAKAAANV